jgi:23S rRNA pseudouridine1911/1915/1917 synthase
MDVLTLWKAWLKERFAKPGNVYLGLVHRLDRPASGLMVLARTSKAASRLSTQFRDRDVEKWYTALVEGNPGEGGTYTDYLLKKDQRVTVVDSKTEDGRYAELQWRRLSSRKGVTCVLIRLKTGRSHQIRVQFSSRGNPLVGDMRYGAQTELDGKNLALHSRRLVLEHPTQRNTLCWEVPEPETWPSNFKELGME